MTDAPEPEPEPGSAPLDNPRWEAFAIGYVAHGNASRAYREAGYKNAPASGISAHHLLKRPIVKARIDNLKLSKWRALHMGTDELLAEAARIARFNMDRILHVTPDGDPYIDLSKATPDDLAAITEVQIEDFIDGREVDDKGNTIKRDVRRVKAKAPNKLAAITLLARTAGLLKDKVEISASDDFAERMALAMRRAEKAREEG